MMENIEAMLCAFIEGDLDEAGRAEIEKHLQEHPDHRKLLAELMATRDLVRELPRVRAPMDVGESLRGQIERSILLDSNDAVIDPTARRGRRWTSVLAIAAVFLLSVSLTFFLYRTLMPTAKPAAFTEIAVSQTPQGMLDRAAAAEHQKLLEEDLATAETQKEPQAQGARSDVAQNAAKDSTLSIAKALPANSPGQIGGAPSSLAQLDQLHAAAQNANQLSQFNVDSVRKTIRDFGYDMNGGPGQSQGFVVVVNATDASQANSTITRFLNTTGNKIAWSKVPSAPEAQSGATTMPTDDKEVKIRLAGAATQPGTMPSQSIADPDAAHALMANTSQRQFLESCQSTGQLYVARGITRQQVEQLKQSLAAANQSADVIEPQSLQPPTTQPTTQPTASAVAGEINAAAADTNSDSSLAAAPAPVLSPTTSPSIAFETGKRDEKKEQAVPVDAVIVVQSQQLQIGPIQTKPANLQTEITPPATRPDSPTTLPSR